MNELLRLDNVFYSYDDLYPALKGVSLQIFEGEKIAALGSNGAGKSTFFLCCNGVLTPQRGKIYLNGAQAAPKQLRQAVGLVFQDPDSQIIAGTVENEVSFGPMNMRLQQDEVRERITSALERMNLQGYEKRAPHYLSGGEKKRVSIADILAMKPVVMLFDEPTASLDPMNTQMLETALNELSDSGITLVVSTHDVDFAYRFATRGIVFSEGEVIADSSIEDVFSSSAIVAKAGLRKPLLYEAAELLRERFPNTALEFYPKHIGDFNELLASIVY
ncbi:MAG: energy-coupling factor ABC transporter ATP-binding protein [Eubacteriaceae bacterium]|nr:energy-coupling factor ABC transporter ATP-binding protein [Eubacteriaceae bacterium]